MAGRPLRKSVLQELSARGGPEYVQEQLLEGRTYGEIAASLKADVSDGYFRKMMSREAEYAKAIDAVREQVADALIDAGTQDIAQLKKRRELELKRADAGEIDESFGMVSPVDVNISKHFIAQNNFRAMALNPQKYGAKQQTNVQINIGDMHLDALRKFSRERQDLMAQDKEREIVSADYEDITDEQS